MFNFQSKKGLSLIEAVIGIGLALIIFGSLLGFFRVSIRVVGVSKARVGAIALANEQMEKIRNLPYEAVGTVGGIPQGNILQNENFVVNSIEYTRRTLIQYVDSVGDGQGVADDNGVTTDYKRVKVEVGWEGQISVDPVVLVSDIMPKGIETDSGGGTLKINVFDASIAPIVSANVRIENNVVSPPILVPGIFTNSQGKVAFPGAPESTGYEITVTKDGYSTDQTYDVTVENPNPQPGHLNVLEDETTEASFSIDYLSSKLVETYEPEGEHSFVDIFTDDSNVASSSNILIFSGRVELADGGEGYTENGFVISTTIIPENLKNWEELSWNDDEPLDTEITYQIFYASSTEWELIPDEDLSGNSSGFSASPVDLLGLNISTYPEIRLRANLSTLDASSTPALFDWKVKWLANRIPIPNVVFHMRGEKIMGDDGGFPAQPIYKYAEDLNTGADGTVFINNLEWDSYLITIDGVTTGYDISESCPFQPASILPGTINNTTSLVLVSHATNALLIRVEDESGMFIPDASVRLYKTGYDETLNTSTTCGQAFFTPLSVSMNYNIEITKAGYQDFTLSNIEVDGYETLKVTMSSL